jgi:hypothetical protein
MSGKKSFSWDYKSAVRKASSDISISVGKTPLFINKQITGPNDPKKDAFRNCSNCGRHYNYHKNGKCPS